MALIVDVVIFVGITNIGVMEETSSGVTLGNQFIARAIMTVILTIIFCVFTIKSPTEVQSSK